MSIDLSGKPWQQINPSLFGGGPRWKQQQRRVVSFYLGVEFEPPSRVVFFGQTKVMPQTRDPFGPECAPEGSDPNPDGSGGFGVEAIP